MKLTDAKILRVNLSSGAITKEDIKEDLLKLYFGGRGLASKILADEVDPSTDALAPENKLVHLVEENGHPGDDTQEVVVLLNKVFQAGYIIGGKVFGTDSQLQAVVGDP